MAGLGCGLVGITGRGVSRMDARSVCLRGWRETGREWWVRVEEKERVW